jgi:membrane protein implicated in regulation of membrane protease activity
VTWAFLYVATLLVGLALAAVTGLLRDVAGLARNSAVVAPQQNTHAVVLSRLLRCVAAASVAFGMVGLALTALRPLHRRAALNSALGAAVLAVACGVLLQRRRHARMRQEGLATVVREIPAGGYGQIRIEGSPTVLAAQGADREAIPIGATVEVVDSERSVVTVRRVRP